MILPWFLFYMYINIIQEYMLRAEFSLSSITAEEATPERKAPIRVKFEIPYFTVSGIQVHLHKHNYLFYFMISCGEWHDLSVSDLDLSIIMKFIPELLSSCLKISKLGLALTANHELSIISLSL
jgi:hypothetical protein